MWELNGKSFFSTLNWHSFGGVHESFLCATILAQSLGRPLILLKPNFHIMRGYAHQAVFGEELLNLYVNGEPITNGKLIQKILNSYLTFNRGIHLYTCIPGLLRMLGLNADKIFPRFLGYTWASCLREKVEESYGVDLQKDNLYESIEIDLSPNQYFRAHRELENTELDWSRPLAIVYFRDENFSRCRSQMEHSDYCNYEINNAEEVIRYLVEKGYSVVRMGDGSMAPCNFHLDNFWDYAKSGKTSSLLDLYLHQNAKFWLGTPGGARTLVDLWGTPSVMVNGICYGYMTMWNSSDVFLSSRVYDNKRKRYLQPKEILDLQKLSQTFYVSARYRLVANTRNEIMKACRQFFGEEPVDDAFQNKFWRNWSYEKIDIDSKDRFMSRYLMRNVRPIISHGE